MIRALRPFVFWRYHAEADMLRMSEVPGVRRVYWWWWNHLLAHQHRLEDRLPAWLTAALAIRSLRMSRCWSGQWVTGVAWRRGGFSYCGGNNVPGFWNALRMIVAQWWGWVTDGAPAAPFSGRRP